MALEQRLYMEVPASRLELRDVLVRDGIGFETRPDFEHLSKAISEATLVSLTELDDPVVAWLNLPPPGNGVVPNRYLCFRCRDYELGDLYEAETIRGVMALIKAYPEAGAYLKMYDAAIPTLLYKERRLVLAEALTRDNRLWDEALQPYRRLIDLPYVVEPLGPWL